MSEPVIDETPDEQGKIVSSLPMSNPKFRSIVEKFVARLGDQLAAIDSAWSQRDYAELKKLGHWLKGSAGSVGFNQFAEPAREVEQFAVAQDDSNIPGAIQKLHAIYKRLDIEPEPATQTVVESVEPKDDLGIEEPAPVLKQVTREPAPVSKQEARESAQTLKQVTRESAPALKEGGEEACHR